MRTSITFFAPYFFLFAALTLHSPVLAREPSPVPDAAPDIPPHAAPETPHCGYFECLPLLTLQDDVYYTVQEPHTVARQASLWGLPSNVLLALNEGLSPNATLTPGQKLMVQARMPSAPSPISRGKANHGSIQNARIMPEGNGYFLRSRRPNSWGCDTAILSMATAMAAYANAYPGAPPVNIGDLSKRRGGRLRPHKSHQSGRDVDIGFVHTQTDIRHPERFQRATAANLDVEKTWFLVKSFAQTGLIQVIYADRAVIRMLYNFAKDRLTPEQLDFFFPIPRRKTASNALLQHWPGHRNHFHLRFKCPDNQPRCRS